MASRKSKGSSSTKAGKASAGTEPDRGSAAASVGDGGGNRQSTLNGAGAALAGLVNGVAHSTHSTRDRAPANSTDGAGAGTTGTTAGDAGSVPSVAGAAQPGASEPASAALGGASAGAGLSAGASGAAGASAAAAARVAIAPASAEVEPQAAAAEVEPQAAATEVHDLPRSGLLDRVNPVWVAAGIIVFMLCLYVPYMGSYGMHDPWETHYGEVAREMVYGHELSHGQPDWVRPHWEHEWFKSKPVLSFWLMAIGMKLTGLGGGDAGELVLLRKTEWVLRTPFMLFGVAGIFAVWLACSRLMNRRTGLLAALVLATCPQYFFVSRQAMTDMPFVGLVNLAMAFFMLAYFGADDERPIWTWRPRRAAAPAPGKKPLELNAIHIFYIALLLLVVPQFLLFGTFRYMRTAMKLGSMKIFVGGWPHMAPYIALVGAFIYLTWNTKRMRDVWLYACYMAIGLAMLGKGVGGLVMPVGCIACYLVLTGEWRKVFEWKEFRVHLMGAFMVTLPISFPWYHAMVATLGAEFWNEMFGHHHWKRLAVGVHGDTGTFDYYLMQLAIGMFPWAGLVPVALARFMRTRERTPEERARLFVMCWFVVAFVLFTLMITKFHHYILPAVPPLAILVAIYLDEVLEGKAPQAKAVGLFLSIGFYVFIARDLATEQQRLLWLFCYNYAREWPRELQYGAILLTFAVLGAVPIVLLAANEMLNRAGEKARRITGLIVGLSAAAAILYLLSDALSTTYRTVLAAVALAGAWAAAEPKRARQAGVAALCTVGVAFTYFALDKYLVEISPHWTQKEVLREYYLERNPSNPEPLIAWQMNWRGETFYTKNTVKGFVDSNAKLKKYLEEHKGQRTFFMFEKNRYGSFKAMLPNPKSREELRVLAKDRNNKFYLTVTTL